MLLPAFLLSLTLASLFFVMLRLGAPRWSYLVLGVLPSAILLDAENLFVSPTRARSCWRSEDGTNHETRS
jgi:hypothetical protein